MTNDPCPICDSEDVKWIDSEPGIDTWACNVCGHEFVVAIIEPAGVVSSAPRRDHTNLKKNARQRLTRYSINYTTA